MYEYLEEIVAALALSAMTVCIGLFVRVRQLESKRAAADIRLDALEGKAKAAEAVADEIANLKLMLATESVRREDWVPAMSKIMGALEKQQVTLARLDERMKHVEQR